MLESSINAITVGVQLSPKGHSAALIRSNSNGTYFTLTLKNVVRDPVSSLLDYERIMSLEGIALANVIVNAEEFERGTSNLRVRTKITFNDGANWQWIKPPNVDNEGKPFGCTSDSSVIIFTSFNILLYLVG